MRSARQTEPGASLRAPNRLQFALTGMIRRKPVNTVPLRTLRPDFVSIAAVRSNLESYNHPPATVEHLLEGLRKAGMPETAP